MPADRTVLLADADVLIDYRESEFGILELVVQHVGRMVVLASVLDEVRNVTTSHCTKLGIEVVEAETERLAQAAEGASSLSFNDRLCLVTCREEGWTCVTNDGALRRLCQRHGVETRFGLGLMVELANAPLNTDGMEATRRAMVAGADIITHALVGILVRQGRLELDAPAPCSPGLTPESPGTPSRPR